MQIEEGDAVEVVISQVKLLSRIGRSPREFSANGLRSTILLPFRTHHLLISLACTYPSFLFRIYIEAISFPYNPVMKSEITATSPAGMNLPVERKRCAIMIVKQTAVTMEM
mmetsp:Transcript_46734/g.120471  ORF Transcript_46734/g.120471 Transcript_46734/m.120471 type:complete len:111 (+) Transcript_46734:394-726(+)